jgi:hypothetical protein
MNRNVEAGLLVVLLCAGVALSLGLAFGLLRMTVHTMSAVAVPALRAELTTAGPASLAASQNLALQARARTLPAA